MARDLRERAVFFPSPVVAAALAAPPPLTVILSFSSNRPKPQKPLE
jgi:hypothetical protein